MQTAVGDMAMLDGAMEAAVRAAKQTFDQVSAGDSSKKRPGMMFISPGAHRLAIICTVPEVCP